MDSVKLSIDGQPVKVAADLSFLDESSSIKVNKGLVVVDSDTLETDMAGVYAGGDDLDDLF